MEALVVLLQMSLLILTVSVPLLTAQAIYYIRPFSDAPCPKHECYTFSEYYISQARSSLSDLFTILKFLPGVHTLNSHEIIQFDNLDQLVLFSEFSHNHSAVINCDFNSGVTLVNITIVEIIGLTVKSCGNPFTHRSFLDTPSIHFTLNTIPAMSAVNVSTLRIANSIFEDNNLPLFAYKSSVLVEDSRFTQNSWGSYGAVVVLITNLTFQGRIQFEGNGPWSPSSMFDLPHGGAIHAISSELLFNGCIHFQSNKASFGGAISAEDCNIVITDVNNHTLNEVSFIDNIAEHRGGAIYLKESFIYHTGSKMHFSLNVASFDSFNSLFTKWHRIRAHEFGGAVHLHNSEWYSDGPLNFSANCAANGGGALFALNSQVLINHFSLFYANKAQNGEHENGGGVLCFNSTLSLLDVRFSHNKAGGYGGAVYASLNCKTIMGHTSFTENSAKEGAAIWTREGTFIFNGTVGFTSNHATSAGGAIYCKHSEVHFVRSASFYKNLVLNPLRTFLEFVSMSFAGGGVFAIHSVVKFLGACVFEDNFADKQGGGMYIQDSILDFYGNTNFKKNFVKNKDGGAICAVYCVVSFIGNVRFTSNSAVTNGGAISMKHSVVCFVGKVNIEQNQASHSGGGVHLHNSTLQLNGSGRFLYNLATLYGGTLNAVHKSTIEINGTCVFAMNYAVNGGVIAVDDGECILNGSYIFTDNSGVNGAAILMYGDKLILIGNHTFSNNLAAVNGYGGAIHALRTYMVFEGSHVFINNSATYGGAVAIVNHDPLKTVMYISLNTVISFQVNYAHRYGAAIFIEESPSAYCHLHLEYKPKLANELCFFQINPMGCTTFGIHGSKNISEINRNLLIQRNSHMKFDKNIAEDGGNILYGGNLDSCIVCDTAYSQLMEGASVFSLLSGLPFEAFPGNITSVPFRVCSCDHVQPLCFQVMNIVHDIYPGQTVHIGAAAVGQVNGIVPGVIHAKWNHSHESKFDQLQAVQTTSDNCTTLQYTVYNKESTVANLNLFVEGPCGTLGSPLSITFNFLPCPVGFAISAHNVCVCSLRLQKYTNSCDINTKTFTRNGDFWLGFNKDGSVLHPHCPYDYCISETVSFTQNSTDLQCAHGRSGVLCGACKPGLSLNLGSSRCCPCSNFYILLFLPFALAGFLLVIFLFIFKVTVAAGTISGLIFYANVVAVKRSVFFPSREINFLTVFIAWINLDLGIETCFMDGMDMYIWTWLQFVFPIYIWTLVLLITLVSYYSSKFARIIGHTNPISVLATLFLLSYSKLIRTIVAVFSFTTLDYPDDRGVAVWVYDGNIRYLEGKHIPLFLAGLLAFVFLFLPYTLLLLFGQCFIAGSNHSLLSWANNTKFRSFMDAYHGPYKNRHRYWTGLLLLLRSILFVMTAIVDVNSPQDPSINLLIIIVICVFLTMWIWNVGNMYRSWHNNILESSFIINLIILAAVSLQVKVENGEGQKVVYCSLGISFVTFLGILVYHMLDCVFRSRLWRNYIAPRLCSIKRSLSSQQETVNTVEASLQLRNISRQPVSTTFISLRETLLDSQT